MPAYHAQPSSSTNLTTNEAIEINGPIGCGDATIFPGDVIVEDGDRFIVIRAHIADEIANGSAEMTAYEDFSSSRLRPARPSPASIRRRDPTTPKPSLHGERTTASSAAGY